MSIHESNKIKTKSRLPSQFSEDIPQELYNSSMIKQTKEDDIKQAKNKLDNLIEQLNGKLMNHFQQKQQNLLEQYKQQLMKAQKQLNELKANTNEQQIRNKMIQRKKQLEKQRHQLISGNMFFSNKCQMYKKKLSALVQEGKQLQREVIFLQGQLQGANKKRLLLMSEVEGSHTKNSRGTDRLSKNQDTSHIKINNQQKTPNGKTENTNKYQKQQQSTKIKKSSSFKKITKSISINKSKNKKLFNNIDQDNNQITSKIFQKTPLEQLFQQALDKVRQSRKNKRTMPLIKGQQFTDYQKRLIMEEFLGNQNVKRKIYQIIFQKRNKINSTFESNDKKIKISFDDVGL